jgi:hypothetical protein
MGNLTSKETGMSRKLKLQSIVLLVALVGSTFGVAFPAYALPAGAAVSLDIVEVLSGQQNTFLFDVTNTGAPGSELPPSAADPTIDWVRIRPAVTGGLGTFTPDSAASGGWTPSLFDMDGDDVNDAVEFTGGAIAPADTGQFTVVATASALPADETVGWIIEVSDNNGQNIKRAANTPTTTIRVLNVETVAVSGPDGAIDGTATAGQPNLTVNSVVKNYGTADLSVDPSLSSNVAGDTITDQDAATVVAGDQGTFTFPVSLANNTTGRTFTGDALAPGADAMEAISNTLTVQAAAAFAYVNNTLQPRAAVSGAVKEFALTVNKTNPPAVTFDTTDVDGDGIITELTFTHQTDSAKSFSTTLASPPSVGNGNGNQSLTFEDITIPGDPLSRDFDGVYNLSLRIDGTDDNGAPVDRTVTPSNTFEIDNLIPHIEPNILAPGCPGTNCQVNPDNVPTAANGQTLTFNGPIKQGAEPADPADTTAAITECWLVITDLANIELQRTAVTGCTNNNGNLSGSAPLDAGSLASGRAFVEVVASDLAGNTTALVRSTGFVLVDNEIPAILGGGEPGGTETGCGPNAAPMCDDLKTIRVNLSEAVTGDFQPFDFFVDGDVVVTATEAQCKTPVATRTFCSQVVLTLLNGFGEDDTPTVDYEFRTLPPTRARHADGATHQLPLTALVDAADGIVPDLPTLDTVTQDGVDAAGAPVSNAKGPQDGAFYTNQEGPTFRIAGLALNYRGLIALDTNGVEDFQNEPVRDENGNVVAPADRVVADCVSPGSFVDCESSEEIGGDASYTILVASLDREGNLSQGRTGALAGLRARPETLVIDNVAPQAASFTTAGVSDLEASFDEVLGFGRDFAADWFPRKSLPNGKFQGFTASGVSGSGASRTVTVDDPDYTPGAADQLLYTLRGTADTRYQDRAGNYLGNFILSATP